MAYRKETSSGSDILLYVLAVFVPPLALALRMSSPEITGCDIIINVSATLPTESGANCTRRQTQAHTDFPLGPLRSYRSICSPPHRSSCGSSDGFRLCTCRERGWTRFAASEADENKLARRIHAWWKLGKAERARNRTVVYTTAPGPPRY